MENGGDPSGWGIPQWSVETDLTFNEEENIAFSFLTITAPGAEIVPQGPQQHTLSRQSNEFAAEVRAQEPQRYGFFATIPSLLDAEAANAEIVHALDVLKADGIILYTRYGAENKYLGHPDFKSTWDLLEARAAVVLIHPTSASHKGLVNAKLPQPMIDYPHETTRTACDLITSGTVRSHPGVKIILSHGGGTLPYLALRPAAMLPYLPSNATENPGKTPDEITREFMEDAKTFYFDTALSTSAVQLQLLSEFAKPDHIFYGSDFPYAPRGSIQLFDKLLDEYSATNASFVSSVNNGAALKLFPRLKEYIEE